MKYLWRKWRNDFKNSKNNEAYYDIFEDWDLIESSFAQQYNIRLRKEMHTMSWGEFTSYLTGINGETALGNIVRIRSEKDPKILKNFSKEEKRIRNEWLSRNKGNINEQSYEQAMDNFKNMFIALSKGGG